jgi:hypothetical protein
LKAQKEFLNEGVSRDTPTEEYSSLSQKDPQPKGKQILMDFSVLADLITQERRTYYILRWSSQLQRVLK